MNKFWNLEQRHTTDSELCRNAVAQPEKEWSEKETGKTCHNFIMNKNCNFLHQSKVTFSN
jgi:hypothetical protein